nr:hypothetical protein [Actinomycetota bacterium]
MVIALASALALTGCGGGKKKDVGSGQYGSDVLTDTTVTVAPLATTAPTTPTTSKQQAATAKNKPPPVTVGPRSATPAKPTGDPVKDASRLGVGDFAGMLLSANSPVKKIVYELMLQEGLDARPHTLDHVLGNLRTYSGKTVTVERTPIPPGPTSWTTEQLHRYADQYTRFKSAGDTA